MCKTAVSAVPTLFYRRLYDIVNKAEGLFFHKFVFIYFCFLIYMKVSLKGRPNKIIGEREDSYLEFLAIHLFNHV